MVWVDNDVLAAQTGHAEFLGAYASEANCFPNFWHVYLFSGVECSLVLLQLDVCLCKLLEVMDTFE